MEIGDHVIRKKDHRRGVLFSRYLGPLWFLQLTHSIDGLRGEIIYVLVLEEEIQSANA